MDTKVITCRWGTNKDASSKAVYEQGVVTCIAPRVLALAVPYIAGASIVPGVCSSGWPVLKTTVILRRNTRTTCASSRYLHWPPQAMPHFILQATAASSIPRLSFETVSNTLAPVFKYISRVASPPPITIPRHDVHIMPCLRPIHASLALRYHDTM